MKYLDFLGNELNIGDKIVVARSDGFGSEILVLGQIKEFFINHSDAKIIIFKEKEDDYWPSYTREYKVMKL